MLVTCSYCGKVQLAELNAGAAGFLLLSAARAAPWERFAVMQLYSRLSALQTERRTEFGFTDLVFPEKDVFICCVDI